jgi:hypothetical protein
MGFTVRWPYSMAFSKMRRRTDSLNRLVTVAKRGTATDVEVIAELAERILGHFARRS